MYDIIIIGAGFSGVYSALELAKLKENRILIIEQGAQVIGPTSTSFNQCYKLHSGVHYFGDSVTARKCLVDSIICARQWSQYLLGRPDASARRDRHYIMSNSLFDIGEARKVVAMLRSTYQSLIDEDPRNRVFGDPKDFIRELAPEQYPDVAREMDFVRQDGSTEKAHVALALDVGEPQVDIKMMQVNLQRLITSTENITPRFNCQVLEIKPYTEGFGYTVVARDTQTREIIQFEAKGIVNCAWQNIETLDKTAGFVDPNPEKLLIRMKISLLVRLPPSLVNIDTCIFSLGPYCSITNQYDGTAILTYEPVTNIGHYIQGEVPPKILQEIQTILEQRVNLRGTELGDRLAKGIVDGCAVYVPDMKSAEVLEVRAGYVKMYVAPGEVYSIYDKNSPIHRRREDGIIVQPGIASCYISASAMKMTYAQSNAEKIRNLMMQEFRKRAYWQAEFSLIQQIGDMKQRLDRSAMLAAVVAEQLLPEILRQCGPQLLASGSIDIPKIMGCLVQGYLAEGLKSTLFYSQFMSQTAIQYSQANTSDSASSTSPTLLRDPMTSKFFKPEKLGDGKRVFGTGFDGYIPPTQGW